MTRHRKKETGEFSESEYQELRSILTVPAGNEGPDVFFEDDDWVVAKTLLTAQGNVEIVLTRIFDEKSLKLRIQASDFGEFDLAPKGATVSNRVFGVSVALMEFADICDLGAFEDRQTVQIIEGGEYRIIE